MSKKLKNMKWASVPLEGFPISSEDFHGFVGLEECTDYGFDKESKKQNKKKPEKKRKAPSDSNPKEVPVKKTKKEKKAANSKQSVPAEIIENQGFVVESCVKAKPTTGKDTIESKNNKKDKQKQDQNNKNEKKKKVAKKSKPRLGENTVDIDSQLSLDEMQAWSALQIPEEILKALAEQGFSKPTKIQELTLPSAMLGRRDILGAAETGSGKTLAFGIPILSGIMKLKEQEAAGIDVYDVPYKKSSVKKKTTETKPKKVFSKKASKKAKLNKNKNGESSEEGYISGESDGSAHDDKGSDDDSENDASESDNENQSDNEGQSDEQESNDEKSDEEFLEEYDVPNKKKKESVDDGNNSDDSEENYVHLSEMLDSDDLADSSDEENDFVESNNGENSEEDNSDESEPDDELERSDQEDVGDENETGITQTKYLLSFSGVGCVKVIDDIEMPGHVVKKTGKPLYALILTPTRELAMQISRHLISAAKYTGIRVATIVGGMAAVKQERLLRAGPEVVVATPGRLAELLGQRQPHLDQLEHIKFLAIDETDRMVERNHFLELHPLLARLNADTARGRARQNFVFSATLTMVHDLPSHFKGNKVTKRGKIIKRKVHKMTPEQKIKKLITMIGMTDPKVVDITTQNLGTAETLTECRISCALDQKDHYLYYVLKRHPGRTIVFCNSIGSVKRLAQLLGLLKCSPLPLHASMPQRQRIKNLERFRDDPHGVLVATDVAARGLDIPGVDHVIHYQVPRTAENYVHRSGRTARATKEGLTILMVEPGEALNYAKLCRTLNKTTDLPTFPVPSPILNSMRDIVTLAREVDRAALTHRRSQQEAGWLDKAAKDMDMLVDEDFVPRKHAQASSSKDLQFKKKQLDALMARPLFPRGFSYKYPSLNDPDVLGVRSEENALQVMKTAIQSGELKREKRKSKNAPLLKLEKKSRSRNSRKVRKSGKKGGEKSTPEAKGER
ncbi:ATP-dependent RNA helicase DDX24 [Plutella xylostella]|uniref:ATP-dependent RNA helicase DDX24 n=1 Tax=Plutella xylostella TaxID=51655 RepID=UPI0020322705|nr:ATP-dependent RNA helicase DDX24 [Plutella xylostella]